MKVIVNSAPVTLAKSDYLAAGGQGEVYVKGATAYKIYHDPKHMIPVGKIGELQQIKTPAVIRPQDVICSDKGAPIGYTMPYVTNTWTLCQLFTRTFRDREGLDHDHMRALVQQLREAVAAVHAASVLVVDLNEMNALVSKAFDRLYLLDADSYQTPHYPATALMESVRDRHSSTFSTGTDWFAFGITSFQMFIGIHPYKGKHPSLVDLDARMQANMSVLNPAVAVPKVCYSTDVIPPVWRAWYTAVFEKGLRDAPPLDFSGAVQAPVHTSAAPVSTKLIMEARIHFEGVLRQYMEWGSTQIVESDRGVKVGNRTVLDSGWLVADSQGRPHVMAYRASAVVSDDLTSGAAGMQPLLAKAFCMSERQVYAQVGDYIYRIMLQAAGVRTLISTQPMMGCMEHATKLFEGGAIQDMLGEPYVSLLRPAGAYTLRVPELKGYRVVHAKSAGSILVVCASRRGVYDRFVFRFDDAFQTYDARVVPDVAPASPNFAITDNGVVVLMTEDADLEVFSARKDSVGMKVIQDPALDAAMRLVPLQGRIGYLFGDTLYSLRM